MDLMSKFYQYSSFKDDSHVSNLLVEYVFPNDEDIHKIMMGRDSENEAVQLGNLGALMDQVIKRKNDLSDFDIKLRSLFDLLTDRAMQTWGNLAKSEGLSMTQIYALQELYYRGSCNMSRIGELLEISVAATSQLAEQLVRSGMVERIENPENRRKKQLKLLLKGTALVEERIKRQRNCMEEFEQSLSKEEYEQVVEMFKILTDAAQRIR
jgi:DNA-binding MarR family transcriptional regulator